MATRTLVDITSSASAQTCAAVVDVRDADHDSLFNLQLLGVGALLSLAATAALSALMSMVSDPRDKQALAAATLEATNQRAARHAAELALEKERNATQEATRRAQQAADSFTRLQGELNAGWLRAWRAARATRRG